MKLSKTIFTKVSDRYYKGEDGSTLRKCEDAGKPKFGNWVLRGADGMAKDDDRFNADLAERNGITLRG